MKIKKYVVRFDVTVIFTEFDCDDLSKITTEEVIDVAYDFVEREDHRVNASIISESEEEERW